MGQNEPQDLKSPDAKVICVVCGKDLSWEDYIGLHRWIVQAKLGPRKVSFTMHSEEPATWSPEDGLATMATMCNWQCLSQFVEGQLAETRVNARKKK